ncbi:AP-4 complex subunit epsilon [Dorcoceras hygrometricum]|uniref:AP-4 complex subunit epsilon n=1 Tax=Dorcoceras hygrometricum TaxID=472368 RepID=A0A2Z7DAA9_9LAMI|nr:AP-4 complex subunit epsilon [Dorcoceras hygrometricum]
MQEPPQVLTHDVHFQPFVLPAPDTMAGAPSAGPPKVHPVPTRLATAPTEVYSARTMDDKKAAHPARRTSEPLDQRCFWL